MQHYKMVAIKLFPLQADIVREGAQWRQFLLCLCALVFKLVAAAHYPGLTYLAYHIVRPPLICMKIKCKICVTELRSEKTW
jgi:hypothetical protein